MVPNPDGMESYRETDRDRILLSVRSADYAHGERILCERCQTAGHFLP